MVYLERTSEPYKYKIFMSVMSGKEKPRVRKSCWASALGGCDALSKEHMIPKGLAQHAKFKAITFLNKGRTRERTLALRKLTVPILCRKHNSQLSPLDAEAQRIIVGLYDLVTKPLGETALETASGQAVLEVDGKLFERWCAKTFLNVLLMEVALFSEPPYPIGITGGQILSSVFSGNSFDEPIGLYCQVKKFGGGKADSILSVSWYFQKVELHKQKTGYSGPYRIPVCLNVRISTLDFYMLVNLTSISHEQWLTIGKGIWRGLVDQRLVRHPEELGIIHPVHDRAWSRPEAPRLLKFLW